MVRSLSELAQAARSGPSTGSVARIHRTRMRRNHSPNGDRPCR
jgi:hypothetical protein